MSGPARRLRACVGLQLRFHVRGRESISSPILSGLQAHFGRRFGCEREDAMRIPHYFALGAPGVLMATGSAPASYPIESPPAPRDIQEIDRRPAGDDQPGDGQQLSLPWQLIVYVIFMLAVIASRFIDFYTNGIPGNPIVLDWKYLLFAAIISIVAFPV